MIGLPRFATRNSFRNSSHQCIYLISKPCIALEYIRVLNRLSHSSNSTLNQSEVGLRPRLKSKPFRALFFGTDDFSVESLKLLCNEVKNGDLLTRLDVVSSMKSKINPVRKFAMEQELKLYNWPPELMEGEFDIGLVVSFGNLIPQPIINSFPLGMLNVHASLLPRWRGAAPIIYSILNGDTETGVTIMRIKPNRFDVGDIVCQESCRISPQETRLQLSSRLAKMGSQLLLETIRDLPQCLETAKPQPDEGVTYAPRVTSHLSHVKWHEMDSQHVFNLSRALEGLYPLSTSWHDLPAKLFHSTGCIGQLKGSAGSVSQSDTSIKVSRQEAVSQSTFMSRPGFIEFHRPSQELRVMCRDKCWVCFKTIGLPGKKPMRPIDFYNGYLSRYSQVERIFI